MTTPDVCTETCGDGLHMGLDACDDGNGVSGDGCSSLCVWEAGYSCGSGTMARFDWCFPICGDGLRVDWEVCDDGNLYNGDGCDNTCGTETYFTCTGGSSTTEDTCVETCGDGYNLDCSNNAHPAVCNECDDSNLFDGDGCSSTCTYEFGWTCTRAGGAGSTDRDVCVEDCGKGLNYGTIYCDDGNTDAGDGCSATCTIEVGWTCSGGSTTSPDFCWRPYPRINETSLSENSTVISLSYNATITMLSTFTKDDIEIYITGPRDVYKFQWQWLDIAYY